MLQLSKGVIFIRNASKHYGMKRVFSTKSKLFNKITVCVEGNIGSGKTTFLNNFQKFDKLVETNGEPVHQWREFGGQNPLASLYTDPKRWAFTFQSLVLLTLMQRHNLPQLTVSNSNSHYSKCRVKPVRMLERSIFSARYCFVERLKQSGVLSDIEYKILCQWYDQAINSSDVTVDLIVYLRTSPQKCYDRVKSRDRPEEQFVTLDYLQQLHDLHEEWLNSENKSVIRPPVLVVNGDNDIPTIKEKFCSVQKHILTHLKQPGYRTS